MIGALQPGQIAAAPRVARLGASDWRGLVKSQALGGWGFGMADEAHGLISLPVPLLAGSDARSDVWLTPRAVHSGQTGSVRWRHDGHWLQGAADLMAGPADLQPLAQRLYQDLFATLKQTGFDHLLRLWNYLPQINAYTQGTERYRQFNAGRQQAFLDHGQDAFEGAPAACALGVNGDHLCLRFLAARSAPRPVDNPRQVPAYRYPSLYGPRAPTFSRAVLSEMGDGRVALWISGTASIVGHASVHGGDVQAQTRETVNNLLAVMRSAEAACTARFALADLISCVYVRHAHHQALVQAELDLAWGAQSLAAQQAVYVRADVCRAELLVEVEGHVVAEGSLL